MIRKLSAFLILAFIGWGYLQAQEAKTCFKNMPDSICPLLSAVNRADFIDFLESKMKAEVTNSFGGKSEMTELSPDYIHVKMTPQSSWQMKLLPINDTSELAATASVPRCPRITEYMENATLQDTSFPSAGRDRRMKSCVSTLL